MLRSKKEKRARFLRLFDHCWDPGGAGILIGRDCRLQTRQIPRSDERERLAARNQPPSSLAAVTRTANIIKRKLRQVYLHEL